MTNHHPESGQDGPIFSLPPMPNKTSFQWAPNFRPERRRKLLLSYLPDWLITVCLAAIFFSLDHIDGYQRVFSLSDTSLRHPYTEHERVPNIALCFICAVAPLLLQWLINVFTVRSFWDAHNATLGLVVALAITGSLTQFVKITVGRPRPDFVSRCIPREGSADPLYGLSVASLVCTQTDEAIIRDGFRSFFSGHSSLSFAGLGHLAYYLAGKLHLFDTRGHAGKSWLALSPFAAASLVAISRTMDYRHHWQDVLVGAVVGTIVSFFAYRQYYPPLNSPISHRPYSPRIPASTVSRFAPDPRDVEQGESVPMTQRHAAHSTHSSLSGHETGFAYNQTTSSGIPSNPKPGTYSSEVPLAGQLDSLSVQTQLGTRSSIMKSSLPPQEVEDPTVPGTVKRDGPADLRQEWNKVDLR